ncbi:MAG: guanylate kinase [Buchnera aphidicola (Kaburagia rhusicola rhusicola)]
MIKGILFIISAPSGTGKSSLIREMLQTNLLFKIQVSISHTTRIIRPGEYNGKHYYFISIHQFKNMIKKKKFLEYAKVFNNYYGTSYKEINQCLLAGIDVFMDIDWQGAQQVRRKIPNSKSIFILPPSKDELYRRLCKRDQDSEVIIQKRMDQAVSDMRHYVEYDYVIINDNFKLAVSNLNKIVQVEHLSRQYQTKKNSNLLRNLLK